MLCGRLCITWACMMQIKAHIDKHKEVITLVKTTKNKSIAEADDLRSKVSLCLWLRLRLWLHPRMRICMRLHLRLRCIVCRGGGC